MIGELCSVVVQVRVEEPVAHFDVDFGVHSRLEESSRFVPLFDLPSPSAAIANSSLYVVMFGWGAKVSL